MKRFLHAGECYVLFKGPNLEAIPCSSDTTLTDNKRYSNKTISKAYGLLVRPWFRQAAGLMPVALVCLSARTGRSISRLLTGISSTLSRSVVEGLSKPTRTTVEADSKDCRSGVEGLSNNSRTSVEQISKKQANKPLRNQSSIYSTLEGLFSLRLHKMSFSRASRLKLRSKRLWTQALYACLLLLLLDVQIGTAQESDPTPRDRAVLGKGGISAVQVVDSAGVSISRYSIEDKLSRNILVGHLLTDTNPVFVKDFRGKAVIFDFWATWCGSCIANFQKLDSIQQVYSKDLSIVLVNDLYRSRDTKERILVFLKDYQIRFADFSLPIVLADPHFGNRFPTQFIPHYVWVDANGRIKAITGSNELTEENLRRFVAGLTLNLTVKES